MFDAGDDAFVVEEFTSKDIRGYSVFLGLGKVNVTCSDGR